MPDVKLSNFGNAAMIYLCILLHLVSKYVNRLLS